MAPKPLDQKRKRGRPPGASKPAQDASRHEAVEEHDEQDAAEEARPKKRGRKAEGSDAATIPAPEKQGVPLAQLGRRGRARKGETRSADTEVERHSETVDKDARPSPQEVIADRSTNSRPRRNGRERKSTRLDDTSGTRQPGSSAQQDSNPPEEESRRMPSPPQRSRKGSRKGPAVEPPGSSPRRSGRERRSWDPERTFGGSRRSTEQEDGSTISRKKVKPEKRPDASQNKTVARKARKQGPPAGDDAPKKRPGRPRLERSDSPGEKSSLLKKPGEMTQPKRRGRPKASSASALDPDQDQSFSSRAQTSHRASKGQPEQNSSSKKANRRAPRKTEEAEPDAEEVGSSESEGEQQFPFRHLKETIRTIPRSTIDDKWTPLDPLSINLISAILGDAQRPVLLNLQDTNRRRQHASAALVHVSQRLRGKLIKGFPFPAPTGATATRGNAGSYEEDFDFERTMDASQTLENTLNPLLHSVSLLQKEIQREEDALANEYNHLHKLETNAKYEAREWKEKARREHVLAPGMKPKDGDDDEPRDSLELVPALPGDVLGGLFKDLQDDELLDLSKQIGSHMDSLKSNLQQIRGVVPAITRSKAALQQVLLKHLDDEQYESILLG